MTTEARVFAHECGQSTVEFAVLALVLVPLLLIVPLLGKLLHGNPVVKKSFLMPNGKWFDLRLLPSRLGPESAHHPPSLRAELRARDLVPANNFAFVVPVGDRLVFEWPLEGKKAHVDAVFKSESRDGGHTWSDPVITTAADIYELGKYAREQSFVGRPLRYNGDPVEPWID